MRPIDFGAAREAGRTSWDRAKVGVRTLVDPAHLAEREGLTDAERAAYLACEHGDTGVREYARQTDRAPGTVGNLLARARRKIDGDGQVHLTRLSWDRWAVSLPDSENAHVVRLLADSAGHIGECGCPGWQYHGGPEAPCAHLCAVRIASALGVGPTHIYSAQAVEQEIADTSVETVMADGGRRAER